jgi:hypothetical protein
MLAAIELVAKQNPNLWEAAQAAATAQARRAKAGR